MRRPIEEVAARIMTATDQTEDDEEEIEVSE